MLGGSATYGEPYGPEGAFSFWLQERLSAIDSSKTYKVINCGRKGFGSVRVKTIFDEIIHYEPDLIIVYFGNNEQRDDHFHRREINIEIRPLLRTIKHILDNSYIFRMAFHLFIKNKITSYGAEDITNAIANDSFDKTAFANKMDEVKSLREILDASHGGQWNSQLDSTIVAQGDTTDTLISRLRYDNLWYIKFKKNIWIGCFSHDNRM